MSAATSEALAEAAAAHRACFELGLPLLDLAAVDLALLPQDLLDETLVRRHRVLPLARHGGRLVLAIAEADLSALDEIRVKTRLEAAPVLVAGDALAAAIAGYRAGHSMLLQDLEGEGAAGTPSPARAAGGGDAPDEAPVVRYIQQVLDDAIDAGASDIHFEPYESLYRIRLRVDGVLREVRRPPPGSGARFASRIKVMAHMDIAERRLPQDGRVRVQRGERATDFRVSSLPTMHGEKIVLRLLDPSSHRLRVDQLGLAKDQHRHYLSALAAPQGMILVTGPTGSGKTVTLYAGLDLLNSEERNIAAAEDPVEINVEGINQVQVNARVGLDFATALRTFLRQDPDVVMVGEIRDVETADTAVKAAQTGHLVLSTLHTNSALETLVRLRNMGVAAYNVAGSVSLIVAQRLVRRLCRHCRRRVAVPGEALAEAGFDAALAGGRLYDANDDGCAACDRGYRGRIGVYEVVPLGPELRRLVLAEADAITLAAEARRLGHVDLRTAGLAKVLQGATSLREVNRVTASSQGGLA